MQTFFDGFRSFLTRWGVVAAGVLMLPAAAPARADLIVLRNGDRYAGSVLSLTSNELVLRSEVLGTIKLPREKVVQISLGTAVATNAGGLSALIPAPPPPPAITPTNDAVGLTAQLRQLGGAGNSNLIQQVQQQWLSDAGPEANQKFHDLLSGVMNGKISLDELRAQAKTAADQLRSLKGEVGDETGMLDSYLTVLDKFLKESGPGTATNSAVPGKSLEPED